MREDAEVTLRHVDAHRDQFGSIDQLPLPPKESWYSTVHRRLSRANTLSGDLGIGDSATGTRSWADFATDVVGRRGTAALATLFVVMLVITCTSTAMLLRSWSAEKSASAAGPANYLHDIAQWHASPDDGGGPPASVDLEISMRSCARRIQLPVIQLPRQLPEVPAWQSNGSYPATPLDELELNCTNPAEASACQKAASSNAYEGGTAPLDPAELAELQSFLEAPSQQADSSAGAQQDLDELNLDCGSNPEACAAVAEETNSYSGTTDASYTAVAEAAEYLSTVNAHQAWDAVVGYAPELGPDSANTYEGAEQQWVGTRNAEEAGPQYLDVSALNLDCNKAAAESDVMTEAECERSVASNRYETPAPTNQDPGLTAAEIALSMQLRQRTEGYDAVALEWEEFAAQQSAPTAAEEQPGAAIQRFLLQQQLLQDVAESGRVTGYDVPAVDEMEPTSAPAPPAGAPAAAPVQIDNRLGARQYFKQPCNCPAAQQEYKNRFSHPGHRVYYKNPANAPATFEDMGEGQVAPGPAALPATTVPYLAALATIAASAAGTWYMMTRDKKRPAKPADEIEAQGGEGAEQHAVTSPMASGMSCELPHFDLKTGRASTLHTALPAIDEPEDDDYPDELDYTYKRSNSAGRSSPKALIEGMTSGMSRRLRESDYGSDTVLEGPSNLQSRPSMVADVERRTEQPRVRFASPSTSREGAGSPFKQK